MENRHHRTPERSAAHLLLLARLGLPWSSATGTRSPTGHRGSTARCRSRLDLDVHIESWHAEHVVDIDWVLRHLGSAMSAEQLSPAKAALTDALQDLRDNRMVERVATTALITHRRD